MNSLKGLHKKLTSSPRCLNGDSFPLPLPCLPAPGCPDREGNSSFPSLVPRKVLCFPSPLRFPWCRHVLHPLLFSPCLVFSVLQQLSPASVHFVCVPGEMHSLSLSSELLTEPGHRSHGEEDREPCTLLCLRLRGRGRYCLQYVSTKLERNQRVHYYTLLRLLKLVHSGVSCGIMALT